jgi:hypothetical protein
MLLFILLRAKYTATATIMERLKQCYNNNNNNNHHHVPEGLGVFPVP